MTSLKLSSILGPVAPLQSGGGLRHYCDQVARAWLHWTGCFSCQRSSVQWTPGPSVNSDGREITDRQLRYRLQWQFLWNKATGEDNTALIQDCSKKGLGEFKLCKTVGMSVVRWWANCTIPSRCQLSSYISTSATSAAQQQQQQQPPNSSHHNTWYSCGLWLNLHPVTTTASRNWSEFCCCVTKAKSIISTKYFSCPSLIHSWIEILHQ